MLGDGLLHAHAGGLGQDVGLDGPVEVDDIEDGVLAERGGQPLVGVEQAVQLGIAGGVLDGVGPGGKRGLLVLELVFLQGSQPGPMPGARMTILGQRDLHAQDAGQVGVIAGLGIDRLQRLGRGEAQAVVFRAEQGFHFRHGGRVLGRQAQDLAPLVEGLGRAGEWSLEEAGDLAQQIDTLAVVLGQVEETFEDLQVFGRHALDLVEPGQRRERLAILGQVVENGAHRGHRLVEVGQLLLGNGGDLEAHGVPGRHVEVVEPALEQLDPLARLVGFLIDAVQVLEGAEDGLALAVEQTAEGCHRHVQEVEAVLLQVGDAQEEPPALVHVPGPVGTHAQHMHKPRDVADLGVEILQRFRRRPAGVGITGVEVQHAAPGRDGRLAIGQVGHAQAGRAREQVGDARQVGGVALVRQGLVQGDEVVVAAERAAQPLGLGQRGFGVRVEVEHGPPGVERLRGRAQLVLLQLGLAHEQGDSAGARGHLALDLQDLRQPCPVAAG